MELTYETFTLTNGLRIIHSLSESPVSYCGFAVRAGTRDEEDNEFGIAHFVEHMLFKGTAKRSSYHLLNRMEVVGGELNAYTTKEETFYYCTSLRKDTERSIELLTDMLFHSTFPERELAKEREVVADEINSYNDSPSELIFDEFENLIFRGESFGHPILGTKNHVEQFTADSCRSFVDRYYRPSNMVFFCRSNVPFRKIRQWIEKYVGNIGSTTVEHLRKAPGFNDAVRESIVQDTHQTHVIIGARAYSLYDSNRLHGYLLNNILGGPGMNSRLNLSLRERNGYVYSVESSITNYSDCGLSTIYFGSDPRHTERCIRLIEKELQTLRNKRITPAQLQAAKKQIFGQIAISNENRENAALSIGKSYLYFDRYEPLQSVLAKLEAITADQLLEAANHLFDPNHLFRLIIR